MKCVYINGETCIDYQFRETLSNLHYPRIATPLPGGAFAPVLGYNIREIKNDPLNKLLIPGPDIDAC